MKSIFTLTSFLFVAVTINAQQASHVFLGTHKSNPNKIIKSGKYTSDGKITFPMNTSDLEMPIHNSITKKTPNNFGVFMIKFEKKLSFFERLFGKF